jgi:hypothetical protein
MLASPAPVTLTGNLDKLDFSSTSGKWTIDLTLTSSNGRTLTVNEVYDYESSFVGEKACALIAQAFTPAVQTLIGKVFRHPEFTDLLSTASQVGKGLSTATGRPPAPLTTGARVEAPQWKTGFEWTYRWESPRGTGTFTRVVLREESLDGVDYYVLASADRELYYRKADLAQYMEQVAGAIDVRWTPPRIEFVWPLAVGGTWEQRYVREEPRNRTTADIVRRASVEAEESVTVPAGTFKALKIVFRNVRSGTLTYEIWYAPEVRSIIRERETFSYGVRTRELTHFKLE